MSRLLFTIAFVIGAISVIWIAMNFFGTNALALSVTGIIGSVYGIGVIELCNFRRATATLANALKALPEAIKDINDWLLNIHPSLRNAVRLRIEGDRGGLPAPVITPYLVGLLVMLGLLGTFVGLVDTLKGAVGALEGTTDIQTIRAGLAAPMKGLGTAFGTSVAGVATSAMLGLMSTLSRRDRILAARQIDAGTLTTLRGFSMAHNQLAAFKSLQIHTEALPKVAAKIETMAENIDNMSQTVGARLSANQEIFHETVKAVYSDFAVSIGDSMKLSLAENVRLTGEIVKPMVREAMSAITSETEALHQKIALSVRENLQTLNDHFTDTAIEVGQAWKQGLQAHHRSYGELAGQMQTVFHQFSDAFEQKATSLIESLDRSAVDWVARQEAGEKKRFDLWSAAMQQAADQMARKAQQQSERMLNKIEELLASTENLIEARTATESVWIEEHRKRMDSISVIVKQALVSLRADEEQRSKTALEKLAHLENIFSTHLATLHHEIEAPMTRLIQTATEAPKAAFEVIEQLRQEISKGTQRDNALLEERQRLMNELDALSTTLAQNTSAQQKAIETLVASSDRMLCDIGQNFTDLIGSEVSNVSRIANDFAASAVEMASLGDSFGTAVKLFNESNLNLVDNLTRIETALEDANTRNNVQLEYYVAQAREIIDYSMLSQKEIFEELRQLRQNGNLTRKAG